MWNSKASQPNSTASQPDAQSSAPFISQATAVLDPLMSPAVAPKGSSVPASRPAAQGARDMAYLGPGLTIKGQITGTEDLQIDGTVHGPITLNDKRLTAGHTAQLHSQINAREVVVNGNVTGDLHAGERIEIKKTGSVVGNMTTARIVIEEGAYFKGSVEIAKRSEKAESEAPKKSENVSERRELAATPA